MAPLSVKLRLLKNLMESQFDSNEKFKKEVNNKSAKELRMTPLGTDKLGNAYWYHMDPKDAAVRVYKDDPRLYKFEFLDLEYLESLILRR